jgi:hypothetical protein
MKAKPIFLGYSWVGWLNLLLLQWLFIRLQVSVDTDTGEIVRYQVIGFFLPMTGWWSNYVWLAKKFKVPA